MMRTSLSLLLVMNSHSASMARGADRAIDQMVICVGTQAMVVYVDDEGQPTPAPHLCPNCALHALATATVLPLAHVVAPYRVAPATWAVNIADAQARRVSDLARAPPL